MEFDFSASDTRDEGCCIDELISLSLRNYSVWYYCHYGRPLYVVISEDDNKIVRIINARTLDFVYPEFRINVL